MNPLFDKIDWEQPWLAPLRTLGKSIVASADWRQALNDAAARAGISNHRSHQINFVLQEDLPARMAYEQFISESGCIPTRDNLHDFFNALIWLAYPGVKRQLNALQATEIARQQCMGPVGREQVRGARRDAATLFDENAALVIVRNNHAGQSIADKLRHHQWIDVFLNERISFGKHCAVLLFGHALIEKLVMPYKAITAHAIILAADDAFFATKVEQQLAWVDEVLAARLQAELLVSTQFTPLPVMGVPGWQSVQDLSFYADEKVFRPPRQRR